WQRRPILLSRTTHRRTRRTLAVKPGPPLSIATSARDSVTSDTTVSRPSAKSVSPFPSPDTSVRDAPAPWIVIWAARTMGNASPVDGPYVPGATWTVVGPETDASD